MKKLLFIFSISALSISCGGNGDINTAEGASDVLCELMDQITVAANAKDEKKLEELDQKAEKYYKQIDKAIEEGKYTEDELEKILIDRNCYF